MPPTVRDTLLINVLLSRGTTVLLWPDQELEKLLHARINPQVSWSLRCAADELCKVLTELAWRDRCPGKDNAWLVHWSSPPLWYVSS